MVKNVVISLLLGIVIGQFTQVHADTVVASGITRKDLIDAAALDGIMSNPSCFPAGLFKHAYRSPEYWVGVGKKYAAVMQ